MQAGKILVTGGTGYIGAHTVVELLDNGYEVVVIDNLSNSNLEILDQIKTITGTRPQFVKLDLRDKTAIVEFFKTFTDITAVIHFAASKSVSESVRKPLFYYENNIVSLINLISALEGSSINFVFSSSCTVYGEPDELPVTEEAPVKKPKSPYGHTKIIGENILMETANADTQFNVIALRYFNPVGAHKSALIGELPNGIPQNLVPFITQTAIGKREQLTVFGDNFDTPDGSCIRDFVHVVDLAKAHLAALRRMEANHMSAAFEIFNVGTGEGHTVLELICLFEKVTGQTLNYRIGMPRDGDIIKIWGDVRLAEKKLRWKAENDLTGMLKSAWEWEKYINNNNKFKQ